MILNPVILDEQGQPVSSLDQLSQSWGEDTSLTQMWSDFEASQQPTTQQVSDVITGYTQPTPASNIDWNAILNPFANVGAQFLQQQLAPKQPPKPKPLTPAQAGLAGINPVILLAGAAAILYFVMKK